MSQVELAEAYRRAGTAFKGQMEQIFVLLREKDWNGNGQQQQQQQHQQHHRHPWRPHAARDTRVVRGEGKTRTMRETLVADLARTKQEEATTLSEETTLIIRINYF